MKMYIYQNAWGMHIHSDNFKNGFVLDESGIWDCSGIGSTACDYWVQRDDWLEERFFSGCKD